MLNYNSTSQSDFQHDILFQFDPFQQCPDSHKPSAHNWTCCQVCRLFSARHLASCLRFNAHVMPGNYRFAATANFHTEQSATDAQSTWTKASRKLRQSGVVALWTREVSPANNRIHYHLIIKSQHELADLKHIFKSALSHVEHHVHIRRYTGHHWPVYICKSEPPHSYKAVLFKSGTGLKKHGTIGKFWYVPLSEIRAALKQRSEEHKATNITLKFNPELQCLARYIAHDLFSQTVDYGDVRRHVCKWADTKGIQDWLQSRG